MLFSSKKRMIQFTRCCLFLISLLVPSCAGDRQTMLVFEHDNELNDKVWIKGDTIKQYGVHGNKFKDVLISGGQTTTLRTTETTDLQGFPESMKGFNPNARFRFLRWSVCLGEEQDGKWKCGQTILLEYMIMYWHHHYSDWRNHSTCLISSALNELGSLRANARAWDCDHPAGKYSNFKINIETAAGSRNTMKLSPSTTLGLAKRFSPSMIQIEFFNNRQNHIQINGAAALCINMEDFEIEKMHKIEAGKSLGLQSSYKCGWGHKSLLYFYINDLDGGGHNMWGIAKIEIHYYSDSHHVPSRQCSVSSGSVRQLQLERGLVKMNWQAGVHSCGGSGDKFWISVN